MKVRNQSKKKPKYNMFQNSWFMIKLAWKQKEKKVAEKENKTKKEVKV